MNRRDKDADRLVVRKAMEMVVKSPKPISEMEAEVRAFLRQAGGNACERCQGNGEIVTDWPRYMGGDEEAVTFCPDCDGTGKGQNL